MIFFDETKPNKYNYLKKHLVPHKFDLKKRKYGNGDGGYVLAEDLIELDSNYILSYGVGDDPKGVSFETTMSRDGDRIHCYDGSIEKFPVKNVGDISFFKENLTSKNFQKHINRLGGSLPDIRLIDHSVLKMDIEGHEYEWLTGKNLKLLSENFSQFTVEVHSLIEEVPEGWVLETQLAEAKKDKKTKEDFFKNLNKHFYLYHIHANNHSPRCVDFPDCLELTYINKNAGYDPVGIDDTRFPIEGLDEANFKGVPDYVLDWWIFD